MKNEMFLIVGPGRSGSSLVKSILNENDNVAIPTEIFFFNSIVKKLRRSYGECLSRQQIYNVFCEIKKFWWMEQFPFDVDSAVQALGEGDEFGWEDVYFAVFQAYASYSSVSMVGDKTISNIRFLNNIYSVNPSVKTIFVIRDPRACIASRINSKIGPRSILTLSKDWRACAEIIQKYRNRGGSFLVSYEELVSNPSVTAENISEFLGLEYHSDLLNFHERAVMGYLPEQEHHKSTLKPVFSTSIETWKALLKQRDIELIEFAIGDVMEEFGYVRQSGGSQPHWSSMFLSNMFCYLDRVRVVLAQRRKMLRARIRSYSFVG